MESKACVRCGEIKTLDLFPKVAKGYKGTATHRGKCFDCKREQDREYASKHVAKRSATAKAWVKKRKETITFDEIKHGTPAGRVNYGCNCKECNLAHIAYQTKMRHLVTPEWYTMEDYYIAVEYRFAIDSDACFYCGKIKDRMETDHIIPIKQGGLEVWWNLRKACKECNLAKGPRHEDEFMSNYLASDKLPNTCATNRFYNLLLETYPNREAPLIMVDILKDLPNIKIRLIRYNMKILRSEGHITRKPGVNDKTRY